MALLTRDFEEGDDYLVVQLEGELAADGTFTPTDGVGPLSADYLEIPADGTISVNLLNPDPKGILLGLDHHQSWVVESLIDRRADTLPAGVWAT